MNATLQKWGNSLALRIPSALAKDIDLQQGSEVDISLVEGKLVVNPKSRRLDLSQMLKEVSKKNIHAEYDWGKPMGQEAW